MKLAAILSTALATLASSTPVAIPIRSPESSTSAPLAKRLPAPAEDPSVIGYGRTGGAGSYQYDLWRSDVRPCPNFGVTVNYQFLDRGYRCRYFRYVILIFGLVICGWGYRQKLTQLGTKIATRTLESAESRDSREQGEITNNR
jgi:hypothetical protein